VNDQPQTTEEAKRQLREVIRKMGATYRAAPRLNRFALALVGATIVLWIFVGLVLAFGG